MNKQIEFDLTHYNSYRILAKVREAYFPTSIEELVSILNIYPQAKLIGGGNNIIFSKPYYDEVFIFVRENMAAYHINENQIYVEAGLSMPQISEIACEFGLSGFETFWDIPGAIGGGIVMNAGAGDSFLGDRLVYVDAYDCEIQQIVRYTQQECKFAYRDSIFHHRKLVVLAACFELSKDSSNNIQHKMNSIKEQRWSKQPKEFPNAGSVFKRPTGYFVGTMIEQLGLKGFSIGGAQVSEKHAGFIVNKGGATGEEILNLITYIKEKVNEKFGVDLHCEQIII